jgi:integrase
MAHLVRPWQVRYVKTVHVDPFGREVPKESAGARKALRRVRKGTPGAKKVKERASKWYGQGIPGMPPRKRVPLCSDKRAAQGMLNELVKKAERGAAGLPDLDRLAKPVAEHLEAYRRYLLAKGDTAGHADKTVRRCRATVAAAGAESPGDLQPSAVLEALAGLKVPTRAVADLPAGKEWFTKAELVSALGVHPGSVARLLSRDGLPAKGKGKARRYPRATAEALAARLGRGRGPATVNHYLTALKGFTRWLLRDGRAGSDPLAFLPRQNAQADVRVERRALSPDEFSAFLDAARRGKPIRGLSGADRAVLYQLAARTGLRAGELASLTPASFDFDALEVTVGAAYSKHRRKDVLPLRPDLAALLKGYCAGRPRFHPLWPGCWAEDGAEVIRADLAAAGIPYADGAGRAYDFHALRHQFISDMVAAGVHPKDAQALARHSTITLTMDRYAHVRGPNLRAALDRLPDLSAGTQHAPGTEKLPGDSALVAPRVAPSLYAGGDGGGQGETEPAAVPAPDARPNVKAVG